MLMSPFGHHDPRPRTPPRQPHTQQDHKRAGPVDLPNRSSYTSWTPDSAAQDSKQAPSLTWRLGTRSGGQSRCVVAGKSPGLPVRAEPPCSARATGRSHTPRLLRVNSVTDCCGQRGCGTGRLARPACSPTFVPEDRQRVDVLLIAWTGLRASCRTRKRKTPRFPTCSRTSSGDARTLPPCEAGAVLGARCGARPPFRALRRGRARLGTTSVRGGVTTKPPVRDMRCSKLVLRAGPVGCTSESNVAIHPVQGLHRY
jgi:hypothetical protein